MLRRLCLRDFVIVPLLELDFGPGFTALTGETGAGKSILIDALQLVLGQRADSGVLREGASRAEISAEFDAPEGLATWLSEGGFDEPAESDPAESAPPSLLLRRTVDAQGKSRAWINGTPATLTQLRELGDWLIDIHGQHAWQGLTRPEPVRALLDSRAGVATAALATAHAAWRQARDRLDAARSRQADLENERERLLWQIGEVERLGPREGEWAELETEHRRLSHAQSILAALARAQQALDGEDSSPSAEGLVAQAVTALEEVWVHDDTLGQPIETLRQVQALLDEAARGLGHRLHGDGLDPQRLAELDERLGAWLALARRFRQPPEALPSLLAQWQAERARIEADSDLPALERTVQQARADYEAQAQAARRARLKAAPRLAAEVQAALQQLGMAGSRFEVAVEPVPEPQRHGLDLVEFRIAGHAGATPRALARVASGGELSRIALAIAVATCAAPRAGTAPLPGVESLIFDEIDSGIGGTVADAVGALMRRLGRERQVFAVTHLPQVAACADAQYVVTKASLDGRTRSWVEPVEGEARVAELARMLGGDGPTSRAHAAALLDAGHAGPPAPVTALNPGR